MKIGCYKKDWETCDECKFCEDEIECKKVCEGEGK
jgi:hypothetical protein